MAFTDRIREVAGRALFGANAPLLESLSTVDLASLVLAVDVGAGFQPARGAARPRPVALAAAPYVTGSTTER